DLRGNNITKLTNVMVPTTLRHVDLSQNAITSLTANWSSCASLTSMNISHYNMRALNITSLSPSLTTLDLSGNSFEIVTVTPDVFQLLNTTVRVFYNMGEASSDTIKLVRHM
ncbi:hypothetical protein As57867_004971, partial [Aphanomyces stellatus]